MNQQEFEELKDAANYAFEVMIYNDETHHRILVEKAHKFIENHKINISSRDDWLVFNGFFTSIFKEYCINLIPVSYNYPYTLNSFQIKGGDWHKGYYAKHFKYEYLDWSKLMTRLSNEVFYPYMHE